jgi:hypothetical protein
MRNESAAPLVRYFRDPAFAAPAGTPAAGAPRSPAMALAPVGSAIACSWLPRGQLRPHPLFFYGRL